MATAFVCASELIIHTPTQPAAHSTCTARAHQRSLLNAPAATEGRWDTRPAPRTIPCKSMRRPSAKGIHQAQGSRVRAHSSEVAETGRAQSRWRGVRLDGRKAVGGRRRRGRAPALPLPLPPPMIPIPAPIIAVIIASSGPRCRPAQSVHRRSACERRRRCQYLTLRSTETLLDSGVGGRYED